MSIKYLLDTHTWIWWNMCPGNLSRKVMRLMEREDDYDELLLSAISPWEFSKLLEKGRLGVSCNPIEWIYRALEMPKLRFVPITPEIAYRSTILPRPFHEDPADQIIAATAKDENAVVLTKDKRLLEYPHIRSFW